MPRRTKASATQGIRATTTRRDLGGHHEPPAVLRKEDIAFRAYEIYLARGAAHGRDFDDWLEAERQLLRLE